MGISRLPPVERRPKWLVAGYYLPVTDEPGGRFELVMEPMAIGLGSLNSNSETHMTVICDARLIYGMGWISQVFICCAALILLWGSTKKKTFLIDIHDFRISLSEAQKNSQPPRANENENEK